MKTLQKLAIAAVFLFIAMEAQAMRWYSPSTGRWLSRDPANEDGGINLYAFVQNDGVNQFDLLGMLDVKFEVVHGDASGWMGMSWGWGQPTWCASGSFWTNNTQAGSTVTIKSRNSDGGACNTIGALDPAGTIKMYLRNDCPQDFDIGVAGMVICYGTGPLGAAKGKVEVNSVEIINCYGRAKQKGSDTEALSFTAHLDRQWKIVAVYTPTIGLAKDNGVRNTGTAEGMLSLEYATAK